MKIKCFFLFLFALSLFSCDEVSPTVTGIMELPPDGPEAPTELRDQARNVLIEEFTGVRCVQCPAGSALLEDLLAIHGSQLVAVSIHSGIFSPPYNESRYDFRTDAGDELLTFLGEPFGYPSAVVNRQLFEGEFDLQLGDGLWAGFIDLEKLVPPRVKIGVTPEFDPATRDLKMTVLLLVEESITEEARLSIMFAESNIEDYQKVPGLDEPQSDYVHKHALRAMATNHTGDIIQDALTAGALIEKEFTFEVPDEWVAENCRIIAFVSLSGNKEVLQAVDVEMVE